MDDDGFAAYVAAHWPGLVRSLVILGCESHEAEDVAQTALIRCYGVWNRVRMADDVDALRVPDDAQRVVEEPPAQVVGRATE